MSRKRADRHFKVCKHCGSFFFANTKFTSICDYCYIKSRFKAKKNGFRGKSLRTRKQIKI
jgi:hypothetical protein